jgi:hypothetical protein
MTKIVAYELQIAGTREDAERAAAEWGVRIRILDELPTDGEAIFAICAQADVARIIAWHDLAMPWLQAGNKPRPGMLMRISQPPEGETFEGDGGEGGGNRDRRRVHPGDGKKMSLDPSIPAPPWDKL